MGTRIRSMIVGRRNMPPRQQSVVLLHTEDLMKVATAKDEYFEIVTIGKGIDGTVVVTNSGLSFGEFDKMAELRAAM